MEPKPEKDCPSKPQRPKSWHDQITITPNGALFPGLRQRRKQIIQHFLIQRRSRAFGTE